MSVKKYEMLVLSRKDVEQAITFKEVVNAVELAQKALGCGEAVSGQLDFLKVPPKTAAGKHGNFMSYSAYMGNKSLNIAGLSWLASCPHNPAKYGLPYAVGVQIINDTATGLPLAVMERSILTEMVTAGASAVGAKHLAGKIPETVGIIGCGNQGKSHLLALREIFDIKKVKAFDLKKELLSIYIKEMRKKTGIAIKPSENSQEIISTSDITVIAINPVKPIVKYEWIKQGTLIIAMSGGGSELHKEEVYPKIDKIVVDNWEKYKEQFERFLSKKGLINGKCCSEIHKIVAGKQKGRKNAKEKIIFIHSGAAVNHVAAGYLAYKNAKEKGLGVKCRII